MPGEGSIRDVLAAVDRLDGDDLMPAPQFGGRQARPRRGTLLSRIEAATGEVQEDPAGLSALSSEGAADRMPAQTSGGTGKRRGWFGRES
jgi:hypothetical protein